MKIPADAGLPSGIADPEALFRKLAGLMSVESAALYELLDLCEQREAAAAVVAVAELCTCNIRDADRIAALLGVVIEGLSNTTWDTLDRTDRPSQAAENLHGAVNWYGRELSEILDRFRS